MRDLARSAQRSAENENGGNPALPDLARQLAELNPQDRAALVAMLQVQSGYEQNAGAVPGRAASKHRKGNTG